MGGSIQERMVDVGSHTVLRVPTGAFHVSGLLNLGLLAGRGGVVDTFASFSASGVQPFVAPLLTNCASRLAASLSSCFSSSPSFNSFNDFSSFWSSSTSACSCSVCAYYSGMYAFLCILADTCTSSELSCSISLFAASCTENLCLSQWLNGRQYWWYVNVLHHVRHLFIESCS